MALSSNSNFSDTLSTAIWGEVTVGTVAVEAIVGGSVLVERQMITIFNDSSTTVFYGFDNTVTTTGVTRGFKIIKNSEVTFSLNDNQAIWLIAGSAGIDILVAEYA